MVRASQGALFSIPIVVSDIASTKDWLKQNKIKSFGAHLGAEKLIWQADFTQASAIVLGAESSGLGADWESALDEKVKIPMSGISTA